MDAIDHDHSDNFADLAAPPDPQLPLRERIGWVLYAAHVLVDGPRTKAFYLALADAVLREIT